MFALCIAGLVCCLVLVVYLFDFTCWSVSSLGLGLVDSVDYTFVKYFRRVCDFVFKCRLVTCCVFTAPFCIGVCCFCWFNCLDLGYFSVCGLSCWFDVEFALWV